MNVTENVGKIIDIAGRVSKGSVTGVMPVHYLYACTLVDGCLAQKYLAEEGITYQKIAVIKNVSQPDKTTEQILRAAEEISLQFDEPAVTSEAILYVLVANCAQTKSIIEKLSMGGSRHLRDKILRGAGMTPNTSKPTTSDKINVVKWATTDPKTAYKNPKFIYDAFNPAADEEADTPDEAPVLPPEMLKYGQDLTDKARSGKIDNIIGRDEETARMIEILCRKTKNNPVLIGEAGVGKSATVEGLAKKIVANDVPDILRNKIIFALDIGMLMAGSKYRGEMEERLNVILTQLKERDDIILFIDELHTIVTSSNKESEMGVGELLKPKLARGEIRCIGATTVDEYRKYIEKDPALERRFAPIMIYPPTVEQAIQILHGLVEGFEKYHKVEILAEAVTAAVALTDRYMPDRNLPDKAIDALDEACAKAKIKAKGQYSPKINSDSIAEVVSGITKIPLNKISAKDKENLLKLEDELKKTIIGQDKAVDAIAKAIRRARSGIADKNRPVGSFFFLGRTGVGKTEICKQLAITLFDTEKSFLKLDMSEFTEPHSVSKLIGSPAGYVGYDDAPILCDRVKRNPYCLVLFDEIEKAHPDIYNVLLQILDEGRLTDAHGHTVSFKNAIIVMTSNVGVSNIVAKKSIGFGDDNFANEASNKDEEATILAGMKKKFPPEFINRIDNVIVFNSLSKEDVEKIAKIQLDKLVKKLSGVGVAMTYTDAVVSSIAVSGYDKEYGIRPLNRVIQTEIENKISEKIIMDEIKRVSIDVKDDKIVID